MVLFNWFRTKSPGSKPAVVQNRAQHAKHVAIAPTAVSIPPLLNSRPAADPTDRTEERKAKRHARREQLYSAIRQAMTRSGVLSASFKFKVLSLDQRGDQFLVMMDVHPRLGLQEQKLADSETLIVDMAKSQFAILVTAVYWRVDTKADPAGLNAPGFQARPAAPASTLAPQASLIAKKPQARFEPIQEDEVTAFKRALAASAAATPAVVDSAGKGRSGLRSYTLITGFEDTEMPESSAVPALSATQYGDLN